MPYIPESIFFTCCFCCSCGTASQLTSHHNFQILTQNTFQNYHFISNIVKQNYNTTESVVDPRGVEARAPLPLLKCFGFLKEKIKEVN